MKKLVTLSLLTALTYVSTYAKQDNSEQQSKHARRYVGKMNEPENNYHRDAYKDVPTQPTKGSTNTYSLPQQTAPTPTQTRSGFSLFGR